MNHRYSRRALFVAAKASYLSLLWPYSIIGVPIVYFGSASGLSRKNILFAVLSILIWVPYFFANVLFHRRSLITEKVAKKFLSLSEFEGGKRLGTYLEGW